MNELNCLLVEDDPEDQELFLEALNSINESAGCFTVNNVPSAISILKTYKPDIIFTDLNLQGVSGEVLIKSIKALPELTYVPLVVITSGLSEKQKFTLLSQGVNEIHIKGSLNELKRMLIRTTARLKKSDKTIL